MSWRVFLSPNTPPLVDPDTININALSRQNLSNKRARCEEIMTESDNRKSRLCSISNMFLKEPSEHREPESSTWTEINETLKEIRTLTANGNATLNRFLELAEKHVSSRTHTKFKGGKTSRDQKSTIKKAKTQKL